MQSLFSYKRKSFRLLSRIWYLIFLVVGIAIGFSIGITINKLNLIEQIKNISSEVIK